MYRAGLAGIALAIIIPSLALAPAAEARNTFRPAAHAGVVTEGHVARLKAVLKLTPDQERLWPPVEAALRNLVHKQREQASRNAGFALASTAPAPARADLDGDKLQRAAAAALPLIAVLNEQQKKSALRFARSLGLGSLASAF